MSPNQTLIAFDLYGTLVTPQHARSKLISLYGNEKGSSVADRWRQYQLEYTWRLNSMGKNPNPPTPNSSPSQNHHVR
jgi:2-haloacid dehalogenase